MSTPAAPRSPLARRSWRRSRSRSARIGRVLILLPPSEGKFSPSAGAPVELDSLVFAAELGERRARLLDALERLGTLTTARALKQLDISKGQVGEIEVDAGLRAAPEAP